MSNLIRTILMYTLFDNINGERLIWNGHAVTDLTEYPYVVRLIQETDRSIYLCTGCYISSFWILTAAHCMHDHTYNQIACMGVLSKRDCDDVRNLEIKILHDERDIAMVSIDHPFILGPNIQYAKIIPENMISQYYGTNCSIVGWGITSAEGVVTKVLMASEMELQEFCTRPDFYCAEAAEHDSCPGDSGGPLVCGGYVVGILHGGPQGLCGQITGRQSFISWYEKIDGVRDFVRKAQELEIRIDSQTAVLNFNTNLLFVTTFVLFPTYV